MFGHQVLSLLLRVTTHRRRQPSVCMISEKSSEKQVGSTSNDPTTRVGVEDMQKCLAGILFRIISRRREIVLIFDDAQWLDRSSWLLLGLLTKRMLQQNRPFLTIFARRTSGADENLINVEEASFDLLFHFLSFFGFSPRLFLQYSSTSHRCWVRRFRLSR